MKHILKFDNFLTESNIENLANTEWPQIKGKDVLSFFDEMKRAKDKLEDQIYKIATEEMEHQIQALFQENGIEVEKMSLTFHHGSNVVFAIGQKFFSIKINSGGYYLYELTDREDSKGLFLRAYDDLHKFFEEYRTDTDQNKLSQKKTIKIKTYADFYAYATENTAYDLTDPKYVKFLTPEINQHIVAISPNSRTEFFVQETQNGPLFTEYRYGKGIVGFKNVLQKSGFNVEYNKENRTLLVKSFMPKQHMQDK